MKSTILSVLSAFLLVVVLLTSAAQAESVLRGTYFNPKVSTGLPWLDYYHLHKNDVNKELSDLVDKTGINFIDIQVVVPATLKTRKVPPSDPNASISTWANMNTMKNLVVFLDYCYSKNVSVEIDLSNNMWIPYAIETKLHIANDKWWPVPDNDPWTESIIWYTQIIEYVEENVKDKRAIALWDMSGNYHWGGGESVLWDTPENPKIKQYTERFVKKVWPHFYKAGERPKGSPIMLPILVENWWSKNPKDRLSAFYNLKKWLVYDLKMPPDYWVMTTYVKSDPATDGYYYLKNIVRILGAENAHKIISTDFKGPGHEHDDPPGTIIDRSDLTGSEMFQWNFNKAKEYKFAGWWWWSYRDGADPYGVPAKWGIRDDNDNWREDLVKVIAQQKRLD